MTPAGHAEARALAGHLAGVGLNALYASPRGRARITAQYTAERIGLPVTIEPWTGELDGLRIKDYGRAIWDIDGATLRSPELLADLNHWQAVPPLDNPTLQRHMQTIQAGSDDFLARLGYTREDHRYRVTAGPAQRSATVALFAHYGFGLAWLSHLLGIPLPLLWSGVYLHPSSVTTILFDERTPGCAVPRLTGMGDISHLHKAGLAPSYAGLIANHD